MLQLTLNAADTPARSISMAVMRRWTSWLHLLGFPKEVQTSVEDLSFEGVKLFTEKSLPPHLEGFEGHPQVAGNIHPETKEAFYPTIPTQALLVSIPITAPL